MFIQSLKEENNTIAEQRDSIANENTQLHTGLSKTDMDYTNYKSQIQQLEGKLKVTEKAYRALQDNHNKIIKKPESRELVKGLTN